MNRTFRTVLFALGFTGLGAAATLAAGAVAGPGMEPGMRCDMGAASGAVAGPGMEPGMGCDMGAGCPMMADMIAGLDLGEAQQARFDAVRQDMRDFRMERMRLRATRMHELMSLLGSDDVDREAVHQHIDEDLATVAKHMHDMADQVLDFRDSLTPEQRSTFRDEARQCSDERSGHGACGCGMRGGDR